MLEYNRTLELILGQITLELTAIQMDLNRISLKRDFEQCKNDVLHLADTDVSLLAIYYIEAELDKKEKLEWVISKSVSTTEEKESIKQHLKNLYYLVRNDLLNTSQYENERVSILNFIEELKQSKIDVFNDTKEEKQLIARRRDLKKLKKYFEGDYLKNTVNNIESFKELLFSLNISEELKTKALMLVCLNEVEYFNNNLEEDDVENEVLVFLADSKLDEIIKVNNDMKKTNASRESDYRSVIEMLKKDPSLDPKKAFREFYNKWEKKNK